VVVNITFLMIFAVFDPSPLAVSHIYLLCHVGIYTDNLGENPSKQVTEEYLSVLVGAT